ncbi:MAG: hypothetical protein PUP92_34300, partial [Rhizonema sp. PD38]|nr:hypothetical protein [Rhizonema sp. PD38]
VGMNPDKNGQPSTKSSLKTTISEHFEAVIDAKSAGGSFPRQTLRHSQQQNRSTASKCEARRTEASVRQTSG